MDEAYSHMKREDVSGKEAPDGGWGYAVCVGVGLTFMLGFGSSSAFGILFNIFFLEQGGAGDLTFVIGVYGGALSIAGFLSGIALKKYSFRQVGVVGAALFILGDVLTIFVTKTYHLVFSFGFIRGAGFGVMIPVSYTAFNCYFDKKRTAMMSANQTMSSLASITFPMMVTLMMSEYGFRGTLALLMAIDLHMLVAVLVMQPVEWHIVKKLEIKDGETDTQNRVIATEICLKEKNTIENFIHIDAKDQNKFSHHVRETFHKNLIKKMLDNIELDLLKNRRFAITLVGLGFAFVSDVSYLAIEPMLLFSYGFTEMQVATCVMVGALADLLARFLLAFFTYFFPVDSRKFFFGGTCVTVLLRIALVSSSNIWYVFTVTAISGLVRCSVQVLFPLVLAAAAPDRFPAALALHILFSGAMMLIANPLIGVIYDATGSYLYCFLSLSVCCMITVILLSWDYYEQWKKSYKT